VGVTSDANKTTMHIRRNTVFGGSTIPIASLEIEDRGNAGTHVNMIIEPALFPRLAAWMSAFMAPVFALMLTSRVSPNVPLVGLLLWVTLTLIGIRLVPLPYDNQAWWVGNEVRKLLPTLQAPAERRAYRSDGQNGK
jgi:hypothetical protein